MSSTPQQTSYITAHKRNNSQSSQYYTDPRCALSLGSIGETEKGIRSKKMIPIPATLYKHTDFDGTAKMRLSCFHAAHFQCLLMIYRSERLHFFKRFLKSILYFDKSKLSEQVGQTLVRNAWHSDSPPITHCKICTRITESSDKFINSLCCGPPPHPTEISEGDVPFSITEKKFLMNLFHEIDGTNDDFLHSPRSEKEDEDEIEKENILTLKRKRRLPPKYV